ncbi:MAG: DNA polymerase III subunit delta [Deltaproteobacteria bacterium]|nr:DNA polymerase III subunit delta [Deltaproteobacteria bacterium]
MTPEQVVRDVKAGRLRPIYLVVGEERVLVDRVVDVIRKAALQGAIGGFNEDRFTAGEADVDRVINSARTVPMMARCRLVIVRSVERWESQGDDDKSSRGTALDRLAEYAQAPIESTCMVLMGGKLDGRRKLMAIARKQDFLVVCDPVSRKELPQRIQREARERGHEIDDDVAELLAEIAGPELGNVLDAIERLSLYVGPSARISEDAVAECVTRVRVSTVWELTGAIARRDTGTALAVLADVYDPHDRGLRLVGLLAWAVRQLVRFAAARRQGATAEEAASRSGAPPFKARELAAQVSRVPAGEFERWLGVLAETDLALKGSKRQPRAVLESAILTMLVGAPK